MEKPINKIKADLREVYDELAIDWGVKLALSDWGVKELKEFASMVKKANGSKVLDLGCGSGFQSKQLSDEGLEVVGFDLSPRMVKEAKKRVPGAKFLVGDMTILDKRIYPELAEGFDGIYARASILHISKKLVPEVLRSIHKILQKKGILYLALKEGEGEDEIEETKLGRKIRRFFSFFKKKEIESLLKNAGFKIAKFNSSQKDSQSTVWLHVFARKL